MDNPSNIHSLQPGKSLSLRLNSLGANRFCPELAFWGWNSQRKTSFGKWQHNSKWGQQGRALTQQQQIPVGLSLPGTAQGQGLSPAAEKGGKGHWRIPQRKGTCWDGLLPARTFRSFQIIYFNCTIDSQARGEGKGFHLPNIYIYI